MVHVGRKRKSRTSHPPRLEPPDDPARALTAQQPHRAWLPADKRLSEKAATPLGGLNLIGILTDEQYEAGRRYQVIVGQYRVSIGIPDTGNATGRGYRCLGERDCEECECRRRKEAYDAAFQALGDAGHQSQRAVARVAVHDEPCPQGQLLALRRGLTALVVHFGLDKRGRR